jgi:NADH:ubiquinone oxidoreductase subunit 6 (subunit J)
MGTVPGLLFVALAVVALIGAAVVVGSRDIMRVIIGLGAVLLAVAGLFAVLGLGFLAVAEIFLYVGGVLVLFLFAIMLVHRPAEDRPALASRPTVLAVLAAAVVFAILVFALSASVPDPAVRATASSAKSTADVLLGEMLGQFELAGVLLLAALAAVVALVTGGER